MAKYEVLLYIVVEAETANAACADVLKHYQVYSDHQIKRVPFVIVEMIHEIPAERVSLTPPVGENS